MFRPSYFFKKNGIMYFGIFVEIDVGNYSSCKEVLLSSFYLYAFDGIRVVRGYDKQIYFSFADRIDGVFSAYWQDTSRNLNEKGQGIEWQRGSTFDGYVPERATGRPVDFRLTSPNR